MTDPLEERLLHERPLPRPGFRGGLQRALAAERPLSHRPSRLWTWVGVSAVIGSALLVIALVLAVS